MNKLDFVIFALLILLFAFEFLAFLDYLSFKLSLANLKLRIEKCVKEYSFNNCENLNISSNLPIRENHT